MRTTEERFRSKIRVEKSGCHIWTGARDGRGYGDFWNGTRMVKAHRRAFEKHHGITIPPGHEVHHLCHNRHCVNPHHLCLVTHQGNMELAAQAGAWRGQNNSAAKLGEADVQFMRALYQCGISVRDFAPQFPVNERAIYYALDGSTWPHVPPLEPRPYDPEESLTLFQRIFTGLMGWLMECVQKSWSISPEMLSILRTLAPVVRLPEETEIKLCSTLDVMLAQAEE